MTNLRTTLSKIPSATRGSINMTAPMAYESINTLTDLFTKFSEHDKQRDNLIKNLLDRIAEYEKDKEEQEQQQKTFQLLEEQNRKLDRIVNKDAYVAVLVDGDGAKFLDNLVRDPEWGGQKAALNLKKEVRSYLRQHTSLDCEDIPIVVRVFANINGLARSLRLANIINSETDMHIFAESFTNSQAEFDFVNVGHGKENADSKMRNMFDHFYKNFQCKRIFFAGCHDTGYVHPLRALMGNMDAEERIVLLESTPAETSFKTLNFPMTSFDTVFRSEQLGNEKKRSSPTMATRTPTGSVVPECPTTPRRSPEPGSGPVSPASSGLSVQANAAVLAAEAAKKSAQMITISANGGASVQYPRTYANVGGGSNHQNINLQSARIEKVRKIKFNRNHQRIDPPNKNPNVPLDNISYKAKREGIKNAFCNDRYLNGHCERRDCTMEHNVELTKGEIAVHRYKARTSLCPVGPNNCLNYNCYLSHHCPFQGCSTQSCKFRNTPHGDLHLTEKEQEPVKIFTEGNPFPENL